MRNSIGLTFLALAAGCTWGPRVAELAPAIGPRGDSVAIVLTGDRPAITGELYEVDSISLLVATPELRRVPWVHVYSVRALGLRRSYSGGGGRALPAAVAELATLSRFPQGLDSAQLAAVLAARHQAEVKQVE